MKYYELTWVALSIFMSEGIQSCAASPSCPLQFTTVLKLLVQSLDIDEPCTEALQVVDTGHTLLGAQLDAEA